MIEVADEEYLKDPKEFEKLCQHELSSTGTYMYLWIRGLGFKFPPLHLLQYLSKKYFEKFLNDAEKSLYEGC